MNGYGSLIVGMGYSRQILDAGRASHLRGAKPHRNKRPIGLCRATRTRPGPFRQALEPANHYAD